MPKFLNDLSLGVSLENFCISPQKCHMSPKVSDDLFLVVDIFMFYVIFFCGGGQIRSQHRYGAKSLLFNKITMLPSLFLPQRGAKLHCQLRWGSHGRICRHPWIRHWHAQHKLSYTYCIYSIILFNFLLQMKK